jgi:hypothetical protein
VVDSRVENYLKKPLFSLIPGRDLVFKTTTGSGPGGQHRNKTESTVMLTHPESGVTVKAGDEKSQYRNKRIALRRLTESRKFKTWVRIKAAMIAEGYRSIEEKVDSIMKGENIKVEYVSKFTCDMCGRTEKTFSKNWQERDIPSGWKETENKNHHCAKCQKRSSM